MCWLENVESRVRFVSMHKNNFGTANLCVTNTNHIFVFVTHKHKINFGNAPLSCDGLLCPQSLTTHDRGMRRRVRPRVLRVSTAIYHHPPTICGIAMKREKKMGDGQREPEGH